MARCALLLLRWVKKSVLVLEAQPVIGFMTSYTEHARRHVEIPRRTRHVVGRTRGQERGACFYHKCPVWIREPGNDIFLFLLS